LCARMRSINWEFSCSYNTPNDLCFNDGNCSKDIHADGTQEEFCICPDGYTADMEWMHFRNCVRPVNSSRDFLIFFGIATALLDLYYIIFVHTRLKAIGRRAGIITMLCTVFTLLILAGMYVQNGFFEMSTVFATIDFLFCTLLLYALNNIALKPLYALQGKSFDRVEKLFKLWGVVAAMLLLGTMISLLVTMRTRSYNFASFCFSATLYIGGIAYFGILYRSAYLLSRQLTDINDSIPMAQLYQWSGLRRRLLILRCNCVTFGASCLLMTFGHPIVVWYFGSFPYFYVIVYFMFMLALVSFAAIIAFIQPNKDHTIISSNETKDINQDPHQRISSSIMAAKNPGYDL
jgi:hypothetical protein